MHKDDLDEILIQMLESFPNGVSDLNFSPKKPMQVEHDGTLKSVQPQIPLKESNLSPYQTLLISLQMIGHNKLAMKDLIIRGSCDLAYQLRKVARFRVNIFSTKKNYSIVLRKLSTEVPTLEALKAPQIFSNIAQEKSGLVLITGATGSGKSTTLAALLRYMNENQSIHIVTLEDPIEFIHENIQSTFNQREQGSDFDSFPSGLRAALRQAPKVILVGEMRDRETMEIGLKAAETGHLVLSTLHTVDAGQTVNRIVGMFDKEEEEQIRVRLAETLRWVVCQRLLKKKAGGRVAAHEIMGNNLRTNEVIQQGESPGKTYFDVIEANEPMGWTSFESSLIKLFRNETISEQEAMYNSTRKNYLRLKMDQAKAEKGLKTTDLENLKFDKEYIKKFESE